MLCLIMTQFFEVLLDVCRKESIALVLEMGGGGSESFGAASKPIPVSNGKPRLAVEGCDAAAVSEGRS